MIIFFLYDDHYGLVKSDVVVVEDIADGVASVIVVAKKLVSTEKLVISTFHSISIVFNIFVACGNPPLQLFHIAIIALRSR